MNRRFLTIIIVTIAALAIYFFVIKKKDEPAKEGPAPLSISKNSGAFNQSFEKLLNSYYSLKDALIESDTAKASAASLNVVVHADSLKVDEIKGDSTGMVKETAKTFTATIVGSAKALAAEKDIEAKRKEFEIISEAMWTLTRAVQYNGQKVYYQYCPMAFDDKGAYWISNENAIRNPYFGDKMLTCGETKDSTNY